MALKVRITEQIQKLLDNPYAGKPLRYGLAGVRSIRVPPFRLLNRIEGDAIVMLTLKHREDAYR